MDGLEALETHNEGKSLPLWYAQRINTGRSIYHPSGIGDGRCIDFVPKPSVLSVLSIDEIRDILLEKVKK